MQQHRTRLAALLIVLATCTTAGCTGATDIRELLSNAERFDGRTVKIRGTVTDVIRIPLIDIRIYNVRDRTGEMVVVTSGALPSRGDRVSVKGTFSTLGSVNGRSVGPHIRTDRAE
jgi:hypothetical protein